MAEAEREEDIEKGASVEIEEDQYEAATVEVSADDTSETEKEVKSTNDDELGDYSEQVQRRINQLTAKRKQAAEEAAAAVQYAQQMQYENEQMKRSLQQMSVGYNTEAETRLKSQEEQATKAYAEASEAGDYEKAAKAQQAMAQIAVAKEKIRVQKAKIERQQAQTQQVQEQPQQAPPPQQAQPQAQPRDPKLEKWLEKNTWFGQDRIMTRAAQAIHETLVLEEDFDPTSDDYYKEIDTRMRTEMPHRFKEKRSSAQTVAPASSNGRSVKSGRKKSVELSPGQVAFAKKMKIPLERYAKEIAKIESRSS
tara:strand:- start:500 stop:1426 length:927 start_codon:yes stop_codon:yes gene_type:complete